MRENVIETKQLVKRYGKILALDHVDIRVRRGDIYGLIGSNGAGKTTLLRILTGHIFRDGGVFTLLGASEEKEQEKLRKHTGVIVETVGLLPQLSVLQNMEYYRIQKGIPEKSTIEDTLKLVGLWEQRQKRGKDLSLGMKQRLGLGFALMGGPEFLVLDEPINGLDASGIIEVRNLLKRLNREKNITILLSSHILSELEQLATTYGFIDHGKILEEISAENLRKKCSNYIELKVSDEKKYCVLLEKKMSNCNYQIMPDQSVRIWDPDKEIEKYSKLAAENDMGILKLIHNHVSLEEYYMNLKDGGQCLC